MGKFRLLILLMVGLGAFTWFKPDWLKNPDWINQANKIKGEISHRVTQVNPSELWQESKSNVLGAYSNIQKENLIPGLPAEVVIDEAVDQLTQQVKDLPHQQVMKIKREFCRDVIDEATASTETYAENE